MDEYEKAVRLWKKIYIFLYFIFPITAGVFAVIFECVYRNKSVASLWRRLFQTMNDDFFWIFFLILAPCALWVMYKMKMKDCLERLRYRYYRCHKCGYDMRHVEKEQCSECGHFVNSVDTWWEDYIGTKKEEK